MTKPLIFFPGSKERQPVTEVEPSPPAIPDRPKNIILFPGREGPGIAFSEYVKEKEKMGFMFPTPEAWLAERVTRRRRGTYISHEGHQDLVRIERNTSIVVICSFIEKENEVRLKPKDPFITIASKAIPSGH